MAPVYPGAMQGCGEVMKKILVHSELCSESAGSGLEETEGMLKN